MPCSSAPKFFRGIRQILHLEATERPSMVEIHDWLGLMIDRLSLEDPLAPVLETAAAGLSGQLATPAGSSREESPSPPHPSAQASTAAVGPTEAACARPPPGFSAFPPNNKLCLPSPIGQASLADGSVHDALLVSPPVQPSASAAGERKKADCIAPPPGFETAA